MAGPARTALSLDLPPGTYEAEVTQDKSPAKPMVKIDAIEIQAGAVVEKTAEFYGGKLTLKAVPHGKPLDAYYSLFVKAAEGEKPNSVTYGRTGQNGALWSCPPVPMRRKSPTTRTRQSPRSR